MLEYVAWALNRLNLMRKGFVWKGKVDWDGIGLNMSGDVSIFEGIEQYGGMSLFGDERLIISV